MNQRVQVPGFGNWEGDATIPYTVCFERAVGGRASGEMVKPSSHNLGKNCKGSSPARVDPYIGKETPTDELQPNWEVPTFGDWDGLGDDVQYTVYFDKVSRRGSRGHTAHENDMQTSKANAHLPARKVPVEQRSPHRQIVKKSGDIVHEEPKQKLPCRFQGSSAASLGGHKKLPAKRSPVSCHTTNGATAGESLLKANNRQNVVVRDTVLRSWDDSNPSKISSEYRNCASQSVTDSNSSYHKSPAKIKETSAFTCCFPWGRR